MVQYEYVKNSAYRVTKHYQFKSDKHKNAIHGLWGKKQSKIQFGEMQSFHLLKAAIEDIAVTSTILAM